MTLTQVEDALKLMQKPTTDFEKTIVSQNQTFSTELIKLIKQFMSYKGTKTILSSQVTGMWMFLLEGHRVKRLFATLSLNQLGSLINCSKLFKEHEEEIMGLSNEAMVSMGPFIFEALKSVKIIDFKFRMAQRRYNEVFSKSDDPVDWLRFIGYDVKKFLEDVPNDPTMKKLFEVCYFFNRPEWDPVLQMGSMSR